LYREGRGINEYKRVGSEGQENVKVEREKKKRHVGK
jgi:hypothetical protein